MQIDHNPHEPSRRALKIIGVLTAVIVLMISIPMVAGVNWTVRQLPPEALLLLCGIGAGCCLGFFFGRWDARSELGLVSPTSDWKQSAGPVAKRLGILLLKSPFAVILLPLASWRKAKDEGDGLYVRAMSFFTGLVIGFAISLAAWVIIATPIIIATGG